LSKMILATRHVATRPLDRFANYFVNYLDDWFYVNSNIVTGAQSYLRNVKVYSCTDRYWAWLLQTKENKMAVGDPGEYAVLPSLRSIDAISIPPVGVHRITGQRYLIPPEARESWHKNTFPAKFAREFAKYDALIFVYKPDRWARKLAYREMLGVDKRRFELAKSYTIAEAPYRVCAHECLHLLQKITGSEMPQWNPESSSDPALVFFDAFIDQMTLPIFEQLYLRRNEPQVDQIDL
jgi:hypothetical protein